MLSLIRRTTAVFGCVATLLAISAERSDAITFSIDSFTGGASTLQISITQASPNSVDFVLQITNPASPSASDVTGFWGHLGNESLVAGLTATDVKFNGVASTNFTFVNATNGVGQIGNANFEGGGLSLFDFGFHFGMNGLDSPALNSVSFRLNHASGLSESEFVQQLFAARIQPLNTNDSSKLSGTSPRTPVPDGGSTLMLLGLAVGGAGTLRRYIGR